MCQTISWLWCLNYIASSDVVWLCWSGKLSDVEQGNDSCSWSDTRTKGELLFPAREALSPQNNVPPASRNLQRHLRQGQPMLWLCVRSQKCIGQTTVEFKVGLCYRKAELIRLGFPCHLCAGDCANHSEWFIKKKKYIIYIIAVHDWQN